MSLAPSMTFAPRTAERLHAARALYWCMRLGARQAWAQKVPLAGMVFTFAVIVSVWASIWLLVPADTLARFGLSYGEVIWYFILTEIIAFSLGHAYRRIQDDLASGALTLSLVRPVGYVALAAAEEFGHMAVRLAVTAGPGTVLARILGGKPPFGPETILPLALSVIAGTTLFLAVQILIGLTAAWLGSARAVFFITQKFVFVLGGLIMPISAYPALVGKIAWATPFPAMLYAPASLVLDQSADHLGLVAAMQAFWLCLAAIGIVLLGAAFERRLSMKGLV